MLTELASIVARNRRHLAEDLAGACALIVLLVGGLHLPLLL